MKLPLEVAVEATGARLLDARDAPDSLRIVTDTRTLRPGDAFLALRGERFDGHDFAEQAVEAGAAALVLDRESARVPNVATLLVAETLRAYMALATAARARFHGRVVAITGSTGKTTTKALLTQLLERHYPGCVLAAPANENNEIGVAKLLLAVESKHEILIAEMGARKYGDIAVLVAMAQPQIGVLTNIGEAHLEIMGSRERLEETKWGIFSRGARAVLNLADEASRRRAASLAQAPHWFVASDRAPQSPADARMCAVVGRDELLLTDALGATESRAIDVRLPGAYNRANLAAAIAAAIDLDTPVETVVAAIPALDLPEGRFQRIALENGPHLIFDAYNASATGTLASLEAFADETAPRRIAVLGGMAELGEESEAMHERVGEAAARVVDWLLTGGELAQALARGAERGGLPKERIVTYATNHEAVQWLRRHTRRDDLVLLKGSRKYKLEEIIEELREP